MQALCLGHVANRMDNYKIRVRAADRDTCWTLRKAFDSAACGNHVKDNSRKLSFSVTPTASKRERDRYFGKILNGIQSRVPDSGPEDLEAKEILPCFPGGKLYARNRGDPTSCVVTGHMDTGTFQWVPNALESQLPDVTLADLP